MWCHVIVMGVAKVIKDWSMVAWGNLTVSVERLICILMRVDIESVMSKATII